VSQSAIVVGLAGMLQALGLLARAQRGGRRVMPLIPAGGGNPD